jgi:hypothetical protein
MRQMVGDITLSFTLAMKYFMAIGGLHIRATLKISGGIQ